MPHLQQNQLSLSTPITERKLLRIQGLAVAIGVVLLLAKFAVYFASHSTTILSDALESIVNIVAGVFAVYSLYLSAKPRDYDHPYGHGKVEFISAGFEGILVIIAGIMIIVKAAITIYRPSPLEHLDIGAGVILATGVINYAMGFALVKSGKKYNSIILKADGQHLKTDAYSSFGIFIGLMIIIYTGLNYLDNIIAICFGVLIIYMGSKILRSSLAGIMDEADEEVITTIIHQLSEKRKEPWIDVHNLRVIRFGNKLHVDCHVTLPWYFTLEEAHHEIEEMDAIVNQGFATQVEFFIHEDPCVDTSCKICTMHDCKVRKEAFKQKITWDLENVRRNKKHGK
jgi:cation diffusion facilitator family transporter